MRKRTLSLLVATVLLLTSASAAAARSGQPPTGTCPVPFDSHMMMHHEEMAHHDHHVGLTVDLNRNGWICVLHLEKSGLHVHMDDVVRP